MRSFVVIGAGVIGLSTAVQLQEAFPNAKVTIVADKFNKETISDGAAGIIRPTDMYAPGNPAKLLRQWVNDSWTFYDALAKSEHASDAGVFPITTYHFFKEKALLDPLFAEFTYTFRKCTENEFKMYNVPNNRYGTCFTTLMVEGRWFLPWLMRKFRLQGGFVEVRTVKSLEEFVGKCDVLMNCGGLGGGPLAGDKQMYPIRGQMIRVNAPWIKHAVFLDSSTWILPGRDTVTIGGTRQPHDDNLDISEADTNQVWENACRLQPSLRGAKREWVWVGLRPHREPYRIEAETVQFGNSQLKIVHNYGHGGNGMGVGWGCAKHGTRIAMDLIGKSSSKL